MDLEDISESLERINRITYGKNLDIKKIKENVFENNWYKEYSLLYKKDPTVPPSCNRIFFEAEGEEYGFSNIRPVIPRKPKNHLETSPNVSETYLKIPSKLRNNPNCYVKCKKNKSIDGEEKELTPFIMPNPYFGVCAQAAVWICLSCLEERSQGLVETKSIPEIQRKVSGYPFSDGKGLNFEKISRLFKMGNTQSFIYNNQRQNFNFSEMYNIIYSYVESGLPVIIGVDVDEIDWWGNESGYHALVLIGHTIEKGKINGFIVHDESVAPYQTLSKEDLKYAWDNPNTELVRRNAVVGTPPQVKRGYEVTFGFEYIKEYLPSDPKEFEILPDEIDIRPLLVNKQNLEKFMHNLESDDRERIAAIEETFEKTDISLWNWAQMLFKEKERNPKRMDGIAIYDASSDGKLLYLFYRNEILYFSEEKSNYETINLS